AVRQEGRSADPPFRTLDSRRGDTAGRRHTKDRIRTGIEQNHVILIPCAASGRGRKLAEGLYPAEEIDLLDLLVGEEPDKTAVGRPERLGGAFRSWQLPRRRRIEGLHPEDWPAVRLCGECQA